MQVNQSQEPVSRSITGSAEADAVAGLWSEVEPTVTGYYWFLEDGNYSRPEIVWIAMPSRAVFEYGEEEIEYIGSRQGRWQGPIMPPDDRFAANCHFKEDVELIRKDLG